MENDFLVLKENIEKFMKVYDIRGLEVIWSYVNDEIFFRAAGKGRSKLGLEIWVSINDFLQGDDREKVTKKQRLKPKIRIHEVIG